MLRLLAAAVLAGALGWPADSGPAFLNVESLLPVTLRYGAKNVAFAPPAALKAWQQVASRSHPRRTDQLELVLAQRGSYDRGNCFQWTGCRGDSIGMMWVAAPDLCKALGGKSWLDSEGGCHDLPDGPEGWLNR